MDVLERVFGSLFCWQLTRDGRQVWPTVARCLIVGAFAFFLASTYVRVYPKFAYSRFELPRKVAEFQSSFTVPCLHAIFYLCLALTPGMFAPLLARDRESKLVDLLLTTQLTREQVVLGRWGVRFVQLLMLFIAAAPVLIVSYAFGGARLELLLAALAVALCAAMSLSAIAMFVSSMARTAREAFAAAYAAPVLIAILPPGLATLAAATVDVNLLPAGVLAYSRSVSDFWDHYMSPLAVFDFVVAADEWARRWIMWPRLALFACVHLTATLVFWRLAVRGIGGAGEGALQRWSRMRRLFGRSVRTYGETPIFWREWRTGPSGFWAAVQRHVFTVSAVLALYLPIYCVVFKPFKKLWRLFGDWHETDYAPFYLWTGGALFTFALLQVLQNAGNSIANERDRDTWSTLLSSHLSATEIVHQKILAALRPVAVLLVLWVPLTLILFAQGHGDGQCIIAPLVAAPGFALFVAAVAFRTTLQAERPWSGMMLALGVCVGVFAVMALVQSVELGMRTPSTLHARRHDDVTSLADGRWLLSSPFLVAPFDNLPDPRWSIMAFGLALLGVGIYILDAAIDRFPELTGRAEFGLPFQHPPRHSLAQMKPGAHVSRPPVSAGVAVLGRGPIQIP